MGADPSDMFATIQQLYTTNYTDQSDFDGQNCGHDYMGTVRSYPAMRRPVDRERRCGNHCISTAIPQTRHLTCSCIYMIIFYVHALACTAFIIPACRSHAFLTHLESAWELGRSDDESFAIDGY